VQRFRRIVATSLHRNNSVTSLKLLKAIIFMKYAIIICALALTISSCKKEVTKLTMVGSWTIDSYYENDVDQTTIFKAAYVDYKIVFDGALFIETYKLAGTKVTNAGTWKLLNDADDLQMVNQVDNSIRTLRILEINPNSSKVTEGSKRYHLLKN